MKVRDITVLFPERVIQWPTLKLCLVLGSIGYLARYRNSFPIALFDLLNVIWLDLWFLFKKRKRK